MKSGAKHRFGFGGNETKSMSTSQQRFVCTQAKAATALRSVAAVQKLPQPVRAFSHRLVSVPRLNDGHDLDGVLATMYSAYLSGLYHIQSLPDSRARRGFVFMIAVKSHWWL